MWIDVAVDDLLRAQLIATTWHIVEMLKVIKSSSRLTAVCNSNRLLVRLQ